MKKIVIKSVPCAATCTKERIAAIFTLLGKSANLHNRNPHSGKIFTSSDMLNNKGFTTIELLIVLGILIGGSGAVAIIWVICHFIAKWW